jgi:hypothetical protein
MSIKAIGLSFPNLKERFIMAPPVNARNIVDEKGNPTAGILPIKE